MREALAAAHAAFDEAAEKMARPNRRAGAKTKPATLWRRALAARGKFRSYLLLAFGGTLLIGVPLNALFFQEGRHPAPLFQMGAAQIQSAAQTGGFSPQQQALASSVKSDPHKADAVNSDQPRPAAKSMDLIGRLLQGKPAAKPTTVEKGKDVVFAQRALAKLGYVVSADGVYGGTTRQAIEKFERANGMPVTGELTQKLLQRLSARSGIAFK